MPATFYDVPSPGKAKNSTSYFEYIPDPPTPVLTEFEEYVLRTAISAAHMPATGCADTLSTLSLGSQRFFSDDGEDSTVVGGSGGQPMTSTPVRAGSYDTSYSGGTTSSRSSRTVAWARELTRKASRFFTSKLSAKTFRKKRPDCPSFPPYPCGDYDENGGWVGLSRYTGRSRGSPQASYGRRIPPQFD
ncbi:hypothetical protein BOTBODRAFT_179453 [Botryobasidium botryosum FD-172 SS1]|uniref:Uncharacterized protein n=1 Tax=Botryobasidium botryosum (strain FD-172 SS1) TaxID=930990 RepID=A0A067M2P3_BOTB1|nr:hypothetical protein BOTBODRAFT_179453 [Botryobasidium botryosum FD-172 SS1]